MMVKCILWDRRLLHTLPTQIWSVRVSVQAAWIYIEDSDKMDLVVALAVQVFEIFKLVSYPYYILSLENPPATLRDSMLTGYYIKEKQAMQSNNNAHRLCHT